jgi:uncharacterized protein (UPF0335 family)
MNIVQLEDDIKSLPDQTLVTEMQNPTGGFPQYLVMSEIKRRKEMRDDYQGRMAAYEKTPPRPTMAEETVAEGIGSIMPSNMPQGAPPQGMPMAQGMPMPQGMPVNRPASIEGGGLEALLPKGGMPQGMPQGMPRRMGMAQGGRTNRVMMGKTNYQGATVPPSPFGYGTDAYNPFDYLKQYGIDPSAMATLTEEEKAWQERMFDYYSPERRKKRDRYSRGMNMLRAGLAAGTARTPEQFSASMGPVIEGAIAGRAAGEKEEMAGLGAAAQMSKLERDRAFKMAELGLRADYNRAMIEQAKGKDNPIINLAKSLAKNMPQEYGGKPLPDIDKKGNIILDTNNKPTYEQNRGVAEYNFEAYESASKSLKTMGAYQRAGVSEAEYVEAELAKSEWRISVMADAKRKGYKVGTDEYNTYLKQRDDTKRDELKIIYNEYMAPYLSL